MSPCSKTTPVFEKFPIRVIALAGTAAILFGFMTSKADAEPRTVCGERTDFVEKLKNRYAEEPVSVGLFANGSVIEVFAADSGTFSIIITEPSCVSCFDAAGEEWLELPPYYPAPSAFSAVGVLKFIVYL